ncbi:MAG: response regulator [Propionibacteriales bacterium]|nr:response regulator [Propionibacteriales bacterium]
MAEPAGPLRVVLAEDHYLVREGTRRLLEDTGQVEVVAAVPNAPELLDAVRRLQPDAAVVDIRMPPGHRLEGIEAAHLIRATQPTVGVVILSQHGDSAYAVALLEHGSGGLAYLLKSRVADVGHVLFALHEVIAGRSVIDAEVVEGLLEHRRQVETSPVLELSARELQVLTALAEGMSNRGIAARLHLSVSSVEKYVTSIFAKLGLAGEPDHDRRVLAALTFLRTGDDVV